MDEDGFWPVISRPSTTLKSASHGPAVLREVTYRGNPIAKGKRVPGFTNSEEEAVQLTDVVPFLVEDGLKRLGGRYEKAGDLAEVMPPPARWICLQAHAIS